MRNRHDYLPAAGNDLLLPFYDIGTRLMGVNRIHDRLIAQAELQPGQRVLEIGCGTGNLVVRATSTHPGIDIIGSDPDPRALARAEKKIRGRSGIRFERGYAQQLPYPDGQFDRVLSSLMLHHLEPDVKSAMAAEVKRVLRPGGRLHLVDVGGDMAPADGLAARLNLHNHLTDNLGDRIPQLLTNAGLDVATIHSQTHRFIGGLTYYRATNPN